MCRSSVEWKLVCSIDPVGGIERLVTQAPTVRNIALFSGTVNGPMVNRPIAQIRLGNHAPHTHSPCTHAALHQRFT
jgi:hypothetical protein